MKKTLSLLLALVMCLSLCACGGGEEEAPAEAETVSSEAPAATVTDHPLLPNMYGEWMLTDTDHPENYPYASAIINEDGTAIVDGEELVWRIYEEYTKESSLTLYFYRGSEKVAGAMYDEAGWFGPLSADGAMYPSAYANRATATPEQLRAADPDTYVMPLICGTWLLTREKEGMPEEVVLKEDYTCTVDGTSYTWTMKNQNGCNFLIDILDGGTTIHSGTIFDVYAGELGFSLDNTYYANPDLYDIIRITPQNWLDYFEIIPSWNWLENAFGETEELGFYQLTLSLKEEYYPLLSRVANNGNYLAKNALEFSYSVEKQMCDVDLENQTFTIREGETSFVDQYTEMYRLGFGSSDSFGTGLFSWNTNSESVVNVYDLELVRADCPLYFIKDEYYHTAE